MSGQIGTGLLFLLFLAALLGVGVNIGEERQKVFCDAWYAAHPPVVSDYNPDGAPKDGYYIGRCEIMPEDKTILGSYAACDLMQMFQDTGIRLLFDINPQGKWMLWPKAPDLGLYWIDERQHWLPLPAPDSRQMKAGDHVRVYPAGSAKTGKPAKAKHGWTCRDEQGNDLLPATEVPI